jgi:predicted transposase/invertase (TIGR01784 family)
MRLNRIKEWEELTIQDNFLFQKVMQNKRICKYLIEKILHISIKEITFPDAEKNISIRYDSKSVRLDVYVEDDNGRVFDIEMQCTNSNDLELPKRTRYYQGMIDMALLEKGRDYDELNPSFVIFICTFDPFHKGLPIYTFRNKCVEDNSLELYDETTKLFLNSKGRSREIDPDIAAFLRYVDGKSAEGAFTQTVEEEVLRIKKHDETRREYMTLAMELKRQQRIGEQIGEQEEKRRTIFNLAGMHMSIEFIAKATESSPEFVKNTLKEAQSSH